MRILMIASTPFFADRGCHVRIYEQIKALKRKGHIVLLCAYHHGRNLSDVEVRRVPKIPWYSKLSAGPSWHKYYLDILLAITAFRTYGEFKPDIIHAFLHEGALIGYLIRKFRGRPLLFDYQGSLTGELEAHRYFSKDGFGHRLFQFMESFIHQLPDVTTTSSKPMVQEIIQRFGVPAGRVRAAVDGVDVEAFSPSKFSPKIRKELGIPEDRRLIVYLGLFSRYQGVDLLIEAIPELLREFSKAHFLLMGYPDVEFYENKVAKLGVRECVTFTGRIDYADAAQYLSAGDIAVGPKLISSEANGKLLNYMACALPTVAFDTKVNRDILGDTGLYAETGSKSDLIRLILKLLKEPEAARRLGRQARERAVNSFSTASAAEAIEESYEIARSIYHQKKTR